MFTISNVLSFATSKLGLIILAVVLSGTHLWAGKIGYDFANRGLEKAVAEALDKQAKRHAKALKAAVADERKVLETEAKSGQSVEEFDALTDRSYCPPTADELRIMEDIRKRTERK